MSQGSADTSAPNCDVHSNNLPKYAEFCARSEVRLYLTAVFSRLFQDTACTDSRRRSGPGVQMPYMLLLGHIKEPLRAKVRDFIIPKVRRRL